MGIQGLLPFLKKASRPANLQNFRGQTVAVDVYCWLHKGAFSCADKLVRGEPTDGYVLYVMKMINQFLNLDIKPILVFDGCHLPSKAVTETKRRENRERNRKKAKELLREGKVKEAKECFQRCVDITSEMAWEVINACRARNVDIIVAPYEADAQLAYLNISGIAQLVVTEDSDLILFGCKNILFKMDYHGNGILVEQEKLHLGMGVPRDKFVFDKFRNMCILSGCDYLPSLPGIGLAKSCKFFNVTSNPNVHNALCKLPTYLKMPQLEVTQEYRDGFIKARNTFLYQLVFDPLERCLKPLSDYPDGMGPEDYPYAGAFIGHERAMQIALGNINVQTGKTVDNFDPEHYTPPEMKSSEWDKKGNICTNHSSIWKRNFTPRKPQPTIPSLGIADRETTKGKEVVVPTAAIKRKRVLEPVADEQLTPDITEGELRSMYAVSEKKRRSEESSKEEKYRKEDLVDALELLADALDAEEDMDDAPEPLPEEEVKKKSLLESVMSPPKEQKSKNPFAKAQSPRKKGSLPAGQFSALKRFSKIRKTHVDPNMCVQSRYFSSSPTSSLKSVSIKEEPSDSLNSEQHDPDKNKPSDIISSEQVELSAEKELSDSVSLCEEKVGDTHEGKNDKENSANDMIVKAPLSPLQTNTLKVKSDVTCKSGKLTDMFSKTAKTLDIASSPAARSSFKSVLKSSSLPSSPLVSKENAPVTSQRSEFELMSLSQKSSVSEVSIASDVNSIDNESFGPTPASSQEITSSQNLDDRPSSSQDSSKSSPTAVKSPLSKPIVFKQKLQANSRPLGLSKPRGKALKHPDPKQMSLRDMFSFKKESPKLLPSRPSL